MADQEMTVLESDPARGELLGEVHKVLALLEADPGRSEVRRRRFQNGLWAGPVYGDGFEWVILWEPSDENREEIVIRYLGAPPGG